MAIDTENTPSQGAPTTDQLLPLTEIVQNNPLPEIVIPESLLAERRSVILSLLSNPPQVDCLVIPEGYSELAAAGLYDPDIAYKDKLPTKPIFEHVRGVGDEVFRQYALAITRGEVPGCDEVPDTLADLYDADTQAQNVLHFETWVRHHLESDVGKTLIKEGVAHLRRLGTAYGARSMMVLQDVEDHSLNIISGVFPILLAIAFEKPEEKPTYNDDENELRYMFHHKEWLEQMIQATFAQEEFLLDRVQISFLLKLAAGTIDQEELDKQITQAHTHKTERSPIIDKYGAHLLDLQGKIYEAMREHTKKVLTEEKTT